MIDKKVALVVPTIRKDSFVKFLNEWDRIGLFDIVDLYVMEDNPTKTFPVSELLDVDSLRVTHLCWEDIHEKLGSYEWVIPRRSDTVRSFAYWCVYQCVPSYDYIMTLDDDCYPPTVENEGFAYQHASEFVQLHIDCIENRGKWFNTLNGAKPRGLPFGDLGKRDDIVLNHGLWMNVLDYDAPTQLVAPTENQFDFSSTIVPNGSFFPMCGMNVMWKADYTPWMYHLLMGKRVESQAGFGNRKYDLEQLPFDRFGDIWCGLFFKKLADLSGLSVSSGVPYIRHDRASNPFKNLRKEANGLEVNEIFWKWIDVFDPKDYTPHLLDPICSIYDLLGQHIERLGNYPDNSIFSEWETYLRDLGRAMQTWADFCESGRIDDDQQN